MKSRSVLFMLPIAAALVLAACGGAAAPATRPSTDAYDVPATEAPVFAEPAVGEAAAPQEPPLVPVSTAAAFEISDPSGDLSVIERSNRMIIKNADMRLLVKDTDLAIDRTTQIIGDAGGYIVSSRVWYQEYYGNNLKYASLTIGVPVDEFERTLVRLRDLAVRVVDEVASGDDVTEQYVDLQSQLTNLEATRARILEFLQDARTVEEALRINQELASIEAQIEQIKGRMNYLSDRSAYSTITLNLEPEFPVLTATPTATPRPTATPVPWKPGETFEEARGTVTVLYQGLADFFIWIVVVIVPVVLPFALLLWGLWKLLHRSPSRKGAGKSEE